MNKVKKDKDKPWCLSNGCQSIAHCKYCGFNRDEDAYRKRLPMVTCKDGLKRKIIPNRRKEEKKDDTVGTQD